ncbi:MAG: pyridoxamine 5'-phosphate oxidase [Synechococcaceae cyanobacterium SM2_3_1]|nr:pyridoxamine 5'-phosphate oxidase [Synechococcaceae cyanobacterium SM2_3_1]
MSTLPPLSALADLIDASEVASLAVWDQDFPRLSLVPYTVIRHPLRFCLLISDLSAHTQPLRLNPRCSLLIHTNPEPDDPRSNHALTRLSVQGEAHFLTREEAQAQGLDEIYQQKFPIADMLLDLEDFHFCQITPTEGLFIQGFGQAYRVTGENLDQLEHLKG